MLVRRVNDIEQIIDDDNILDRLQGKECLVAKRVKGMEDKLNFSGLAASDKEVVTRWDKLYKCREAKMSKRGPTDEEIDLAKLG